MEQGLYVEVGGGGGVDKTVSGCVASRDTFTS